jgi:hypothetical protein
MFGRRLALFAAGLMCATSCWSACRNHKIAEPGDVRIDGDSVMIVVHQSSTYDARFSTKRGIDEAVRFAKMNRIPLVYLQDDTPDEYYFMEDCYPDYWVFSQAGEIRFEVAPSHVYIVGGHLELCMEVALADILLQWRKRSPQDFTVTYFMDAIYSNGRKVDPSDPFYGDFVKFMNVVTYGRPGGEHWPKLNLLETMGIILREEHQVEYARQILPRWDRTFPEEYRVALKFNDGPERVLQEGAGLLARRLLFRLIDSAANLNEPMITRAPYP